MRRGAWAIVGLAAAGLGAGGLGVWATWPESVPPPDWSAEYDTEARPPEQITPGTVVDTSPLQGWSHLVLKSLPRVRDDQRAGLPALTVDKASWMCTAFAADVVPEQQGVHTRYRLRAVGLGLGAEVSGRGHVVLTSDTGRKLGADMGLFGGLILDKGYEVQRRSVVAVLGPTMGLVDTPVWFRCGGENKLVRYRYALLPDPATGRLDVLMWSLGADGAACGQLAEVVRIATDTVDAPELVVDRAKVNRFGAPSDDAFAVEAFPAGKRQPLPPDLRPLAAQTRFTPDEARELERRLRNLPVAD
ncbi:MAG: hypothetical protein K2X82_10590 [Gemmataceae bacterium]|nr:hypothetical protein [Gemmataceae bacterium]